MINTETARSDHARLDFAALYDQFYDQIYAYIAYRVGDAVLADDLTAHTFERALTRAGTYRAERGAPGAWLFGIARNAVGGHYQRQRRQRWLALEFFGDRASEQPGPAEQAERAEGRAELYAALARLKPRDRDLLALRFGARLTNRQIAAITGLGESNVGVLLFRAIQRLRALLAPRGEPS